MECHYFSTHKRFNNTHVPQALTLEHLLLMLYKPVGDNLHQRQLKRLGMTQVRRGMLHLPVAMPVVDRHDWD
jgi:hypothetical protein